MLLSHERLHEQFREWCAAEGIRLTGAQQVAAERVLEGLCCLPGHCSGKTFVLEAAKRFVNCKGKSSA